MPMNSLPRWLISITDMPLPCQSSISAAALRKTGSGTTAGPGLKLNTRINVPFVVLINKQGRRAAPLSWRRKPSLRLRDRPQIRLVRLVALRILFLRVVVGNRGGDDDVLARLPVHGRRYRVLRVQLQRVEQAQYLVEVAARAHRVDEDRLDLLVGADEEHVAHRRVVHRRAFAAARVGMDHVVGLRDMKVRVADHRIVDRGPLRFLNILHPRLVVADWVDADADDLGVALVELGFELGHVTQLGRAYGREILRVREQDRPLVPDKLVEPDRTFGGFRREVRCFVTNAYWHIRPPFFALNGRDAVHPEGQSAAEAPVVGTVF